MGGTKVLDPEMHVIVLDHATPAPTTTHAENHRIIREFVSEQGIENFFDVGRGICRQVVENRMPCRQGQALRLLADERRGEKNWSLRIKKN